MNPLTQAYLEGVCPECRQQHPSPKTAEQCLIASLNREIITLGVTSENDPESLKTNMLAHTHWVNVRMYYTSLVWAQQIQARQLSLEQTVDSDQQIITVKAKLE